MIRNLDNACRGMVGLALVGMLAGACAPGVSEQACRDRVARAISVMGAEGAAPTLLFKDEYGGSQMTKRLQQATPGCVYAGLWLPDGTPFAVSGPHKGRIPELEVIKAGAVPGRGTLWVATPVHDPAGAPIAMTWTDNGAVLPAGDDGPPRADGAVVEGPKTRPGTDDGGILPPDPSPPPAPTGPPKIIGWLVIGYETVEE